MSAEIEFVRAKAREVYTVEGVQIWMHARNAALGGWTPIELIEQGQGQRVMDCLDALAEGVMG